MSKLFGLRIAARYLFSKKTHNAVNIITAVALCTTAIATAAIIIVLSVFNGFTELAKSKFSKLDPPLKIISAADEFFDADSLVAAISDIRGTGTLLPVVETKVFVEGATSQSAAVLRGVDERFVRVSGLESALIDGAAFVGDTLGVGWGLLGSGLAVSLWERPGNGQPLQLMVPKRKGRLNPGSPLASFRTDSIYTAGVFQIDDAVTDASVMFVPIEMASQLSGIDTGVASAIYVYPNENIDVETLRTSLAEGGFELLDLLSQNREAFKMIEVEKWITFALLTFILVIASFNIISTLTMLIIEKRGNMAVLRAMGCSRGKVKSVFAWEGVLLSLFGGVAGCVVGALLTEGQSVFGWVKLSGDIDPDLLTINVYPVMLEASDFFVVLGLIIFLSVVTTAISLSTFRIDEDKTKT